jgi:hypothetical protein
MAARCTPSSNRLLTQSFGISFALLRKLNDLFG